MTTPQYPGYPDDGSQPGGVPGYGAQPGYGVGLISNPATDLKPVPFQTTGLRLGRHRATAPSPPWAAEPVCRTTLQVQWAVRR